MLSVGGKTLLNDGAQLTLGSILSFLWECYTDDPEACYVGFFLGYDFIQWEKLLPERQAYLLLTNAGIKERTSQVVLRKNLFPDPVVWDTWEIDIMAGRRFKLRPHTHRRSKYTSLCRNRTCAVSMEDTDGFDFDDIGELVPGEIEWTPNLDPDAALPFPGWKTFIHAKNSARVASDSWLYICDTGAFWQTSFLNVIDPKGWGTGDSVVTGPEFDLLKAGKDSRSRIVPYGQTDYLDEMQRYNILENEILSRVTERLNRGFMNDAIPIRIKRNEWYGPGRAAQTWMDMLHNRVADRDAVTFNNATGLRGKVGSRDRWNERGILNADVYQSMPTWFNDAARASYYGGWFEQFCHGHCGDVWEYDINSAYPFIIASLPCLHTDGSHNGSYLHGTGNDHPVGREYFTLIHATISGTNPHIGVMPFRTKQGNILRPLTVRGWYWTHEVDASRNAGLVENVDVHEWVSYKACTCPSPFNPADIGIERMYNLRLEVGKDSPAGKAFKLVYNSAYGKTAQSVGTPKFANPVYASLITAGCRTLILEAIASHPSGSSAVTMVATDGVYFTERHPGLPLSKTQLGAWDETFKEGMTQFMPGVYWDNATRKLVKEGAAPKMKSRGVAARDLAKQIGNLDNLFAQAYFALQSGEPFEWPSIKFRQNFLLTSAKLALQRGKWDEAGRVTHDAERSISSNPQNKRQSTAYRDDVTGVVRTRPYPQWTTIDTQPYSKAFGYMDSEEESELLDRDGRDGLAYFRDLLNP